MTTTKPNVDENGKYSIGETAKALEVSRQTVKRYADNGMLKCGIWRHNGRKFFYGSEIIRFWRASL